MNSTQCSVDGCERTNKMSRGMCGMHYMRWRSKQDDFLPIAWADQCSVEGCDRGGKIKRGWCEMHYERWRKTGTTDLIPVHPLVVAAKRLADGLVRMPNGCLEWTRATNSPGGYGVMRFDGRQVGTHRVAWILANGPIPDGLFVCHACDNPPCAQTEPTPGYPDGHLFLGTPAENMTDKAAKGRSINGNALRTHCKNGHEFTEANTYMFQGRRHCRTCRRLSSQSRT